MYRTFEILYSIVFFTKGFVQTIDYLVTVTLTSVGVPIKYIGVNIGASFDIKNGINKLFSCNLGKHNIFNSYHI